MFWIHASNAARFEQSFHNIADCIKIFGRHNPQANILQIVHDWLRDERKGKWVVILDNVDDASFLVDALKADHDSMPTNSSRGGESRPLVWYIPKCENGSVLITTRSKSAARKLVVDCDIIAVESMDRAGALALFSKKLGMLNEIDSIVELATALNFIPLAIVQAASYISQRGPRYSVRQYLEAFRKSDRKKAILLNLEGGQLRRDSEAKNSIIVTLQISFDHVRKTRPSAADLLSLMSFFDRQGIPESLLRNPSNRAEQDPKKNTGDGRIDNYSDHDHDGEVDDENYDVSSQSSVIDEFEDNISILQDYSFVSVNTDGTTFEMYGPVQLAIREWLIAHGQQNKWNQQFISNLYVKFPVGVYENWAVCQALFPHVKSAAAQKPEEQKTLKTWASLLYNAAWYAWSVGNGPEAEDMSVQAMNVRMKILGNEHIETLSSMAMAGSAFNLRGRWDAAEKIFVQLVETRKRVLGAQHPDTLASISNLALTYSNQGRWKEAEELEMQVIETRKNVVGEEHPDTLTSMNNLALVLNSQGRYEEAERIHRQTLALKESVLGKKHPDTLMSMNNLAEVLDCQSKYEEAERIHRQTLALMESILGEKHPFTLTSMANLASTYWNQDRWEEAEGLEVRVMETRKSVLGAEHPNTLISMHNLAHTWKFQSRNEEAVSLMKDCFELRNQVLGPEHSDTKTSLEALRRWESEEDRFEH